CCASAGVSANNCHQYRMAPATLGRLRSSAQRRNSAAHGLVSTSCVFAMASASGMGSFLFVLRFTLMQIESALGGRRGDRIALSRFLATAGQPARQPAPLAHAALHPAHIGRTAERLFVE